jgi:tetratricopeptide (TPR) repeat protein
MMRAVLLACLAPAVLAAQTGVTPMARAMAAERRGDYAEAATQFALMLDRAPNDGGALLGLSRVLPPLGRMTEFAPRIGRALGTDSTNLSLLALAVRTHALISQPDSAARWARQWAALSPGDEEPWREWAMSALEVRDRASARRALELGRDAVGHPAALAPELAQLRQVEGDFAGAARDWVRAVNHTAAFRATAVLLLGDTPPDRRPAVAAVLLEATGEEPKRLAALLQARWGEPEAGARTLAAAMPADADAAAQLARAFFDETRGRTDRAALVARGVVLGAVAERQRGLAAVRTRMDAARAFADAGREAEARGLLALVVADPEAPPNIATAASATLLGVLVAEGRAAEAESLLVVVAPTLTMDERDREARRIAMVWARRGEHARALALIQADSSVAAFDVRGRVALLQGNLTEATAMFRIAGPYDDDREHAVDRVRLLALLHAVGTDSLPALGGALATLERGDSAAAARQLSALATEVGGAGGAALALLAGDLEFGLGRLDAAEQGYRMADAPDAPATAPAARFGRARVLAARSATAEAMTMLEQLILEFPDSAVVPEARRLRDQLRGARPGASA